MKKILALVLAVLMLLSALSLVACGGDGGKETKDTPKDTSESKDTSGSGESGDSDESAESKESKYLDNLNEKYDFGDEINFCVRGNDVMIENYDEGEGEFESTDVVQVAIFQRWTEIEERLNVIFGGKFSQDDGEINGNVTNDNQSGSNEYDIVEGHMKFNAALATKGNLANLGAIPNVDLSQNYYNPDYISKFTYKDYTFWSTGDMVKGYLDELTATFVYNKIWNQYYGDPEDNEGVMTSLFAIVEEGKWTLAKVRELTEGVYNEGADAVRGTADDTVGWIYDDTGWVVAAVMSGAGYNYTIPDGKYKYALDLCSAENEVIFAEFKKGFSENPSAFGDSIFANNDAEGYFKSGHALLYHQTLSKTGSLRDLEKPGYSIVPMPKMSEETEYRTPSYDGIQIAAINASVKNNPNPTHIEAVGATFEALAAAGKKYITEAYFEVALKAKNAKNEGSYRCLNTVRETGYSDFAFCWTGPLGQIDIFLANAWREASLANVKSQQGQYETKLKALYTDLGNVQKAGW